MGYNGNKTHGMSKTPIYRLWASMITRCHYEGAINYKHYGGRGIKVCERWKKSFAAFYEDMGDRPGKNYSLDRIDNNGDYYKENCRWAEIKIQRRNRRNNIYITYNGKTQIIQDWAKEFNIYPAAIKYRLDNNYPTEKLFKGSTYKKNLNSKNNE